MISGFGKRSQQAGAEIGADPDLYTACKVVNSYPDPACQFAKPVSAGPACQVPDHTGMHCLPSSKFGRQCTAWQVEKYLASSCVDAQNRQRVFAVLTVECCVDIFVSVRKKGPWVNRVQPGSLSVLP